MTDSEVELDFDLNEVPKPEVDCTICLCPVDIKQPRGYAKLQCGHEFHLDCIGSTFNVRGFMKCPNCRDQERSDWLFSVYTGDSRNDVDLVNWISDHHPFFVVPDGYHLCPGRGFVGADNVPVKGHIIYGMSSQDDFEVQMSPSPRGIQIEVDTISPEAVRQVQMRIAAGWTNPGALNPNDHREVQMRIAAERANPEALNPNDHREVQMRIAAGWTNPEALNPNDHREVQMRIAAERANPEALNPNDHREVQMRIAAERANPEALNPNDHREVQMRLAAERSNPEALNPNDHREVQMRLAAERSNPEALNPNDHRQVQMRLVAERSNPEALNPNDHGEGNNSNESDDQEGSFSVNGSSANENDHQNASSSSSNGQYVYRFEINGVIFRLDEHMANRDYLTALRRVYGSTHLPTFNCATCAERNPSTANTLFSGHTVSSSSTQRVSIFNTTLTEPQPSVMPSARGTQVPYDFNQADDMSSPFAPAVRRALAELAPPDGSPIITSNGNSHLNLTGVPIYNPQDDEDIPMPNNPPAPQGNGPQ